VTRATIVLNTDRARETASGWCSKLPLGTVVEFRAPKRSLPQNDRMWALLTAISTQAKYCGVRLAPDDWKVIFMHALNQEMRMVPNLDGTGFIDLGRSSSKLSVAEMGDLMILIEAYAAREGIALGDNEGK
jgi:hypothetical protein